MRLSNRCFTHGVLAVYMRSRDRLFHNAKSAFSRKYIECENQGRFYSSKTSDILKKMLGLKDLGVKQSFKEHDLKGKKFTVSVEGNIGCGKTTLLEYYANSANTESIPEPVEQWTNVRGHNALGMLYEEPKRWSFSFNSYAQLSRIEMHKKPQSKPVKMLERSLFSTQYCFVENDYRNGTLNALEYAILTEWFNWLIESQKVKVDLIVYLRADPEVCYQRIKKRSRKEESCVPFKLIEELHTLHEEWLIHEKVYKAPAPVLVLDANNSYDRMKSLLEDKRHRVLCGFS